MLLLKNCMRLATFDDDGAEYDGEIIEDKFLFAVHIVKKNMHRARNNRFHFIVAYNML